MLIFNFGGGFYASTGTGQSALLKFLSYISPARYSTELLLRRVLAGKAGGDMVLTMLGFTWGSATCVTLLVSFIILCFLMGWIVLIYETRNY